MAVHTDRQKSGATITFSWTAEHHLLGITYPNGSTSTFRYDPAGRRVEIVDGATTTRYAFDGQAIAAEYDGANALGASYVHHPTSPTTTYEMTRGGQRYFYLTDALGSTMQLVTAGGAVANSYTYGAFGVPTQTGTVENPFTYTGQLFDRQAGLYLFPVRVYDPALGRFLGEDPNPSANAYPYVKNNPTNLVDPSGASSTSETVIEDTAINPFAQTYIRGGGARIGTRCFFLVFETLAFAAFGSASWTLDPFLLDLIHQRAIQLCESI